MSLRPSQPRNQRNSPSPIRRRLNDTDFKYRKINVEENEIRLLRLLPGAEGSMVKCELFHNSLDNSRNYTALSYTWGIAEHTRLIKLDKFEFPVTDNLEFALQRLRSRDHTVILWVDAICINQDSNEERSDQVRLMMSIYRTARRVAIWLGPEEDDSMTAMDLIWKLYWNPGFLNSMIDDPDLLPDVKALALLFHRDYWDRLWVLQEVLNARKKAVYCGKDAIPYSMLETVSEMFRNERKRLIVAFHKYTYKGLTWGSIIEMGGPRKLEDRRTMDGRESSMLETLVFHREKLCAKPEDKVYGILGVLSSRERRKFKVDYKLSAREVFLDVTRYLLEETQSLDFLCSAIPMEPNVHRLPSWVPDWEYRPPIFPLANGVIEAPCHAAAGIEKPLASVSDDGDILRFEGIYIDTIKDLGIPLPFRTDWEIQIVTFLQWYSVLTRFREQTTRQDHEDFVRALWCDELYAGWTPAKRTDWTYWTFASLSREYTTQVLDDYLAFYAGSFQPYMLPQRTDLFQGYIRTAIRGRRYIISETGLQGIGPEICHYDDIIVVALGCTTPLVLRKEDQGYSFVGEAYINSYMYGKAVNEVNSGMRRLETFEIH
jgi:hypothetical protein